MAHVHFHTSSHLATFILTVTISQLVTVAQISVVAFPDKFIAADLNTSASQAAWPLAAYALTSGVFVLVTGRLGDILGHKALFVTGWAWMGIWSLASSFATSSPFFCVCRALAGLGSACLGPAAMALLGRAFTPDSTPKNISMAILGAFAPAGYVFGGLLGAVLAEKASWRWAVRLLAFASWALGAAGLIVVPTEIGSPVGTKGRRFDWYAACTGAIALILLSYSFNEGAVVGWHHPYVYALFIVAVVFGALFAMFQRHGRATLIPPSLYKAPNFYPVIASCALGWMSFGIWLYYTTVFTQRYRGRSSLEAVAEMAALAPMGVVATACVGAFVNRVPCQWIFGAAMLAFFAGNIIMALTPQSQSFWAMVFPATLVIPFGPDLSFASSAIILSNAVPAEDQGAAAGVVNTVVLYAISLGIGIAATLERYVAISRGGDAFTGQRAAYFLAAAMAAVAVPIVAIFVRDTRSSIKAATQLNKT